MTEVPIWLQVFPTTRRMSCSIATWNEIGVFFSLDYWVTPRLAAGTKPMGYPKGRSGSSSLWSTAGFKPRGRYNLIDSDSALPTTLISGHVDITVRYQIFFLPLLPWAEFRIYFFLEVG